MTPKIAIIGGGPAGLMAAQTVGTGIIFEAMPTPARKFLLAGRGGLNLTHSEPLEKFVSRYLPQHPLLIEMLEQFGPQQVVSWCKSLGFETFVGSSKRIFPKSMKAAPLLRAWLKRLNLEVRTRHRWLGWGKDGTLIFSTPQGILNYRADASVLALGGASWQRMGATAEWVDILDKHGVAISPLQPANVGYEVNWSSVFRERYAGAPVKSVSLTVDGKTRQGEFVITKHGLEGSLFYPFCPSLRSKLPCKVYLDLLPQRSLEKVQAGLSKKQGSQSFSKYLKRQTGLSGVKLGLVYECLGRDITAQSLKALPLPLERPRPLAEAISTAGGIRFQELDRNLMLKKLPGVFCAGEMLDWEAPTGGYLLTGCFSSGYRAGLGLRSYLGLKS